MIQQLKMMTYYDHIDDLKQIDTIVDVKLSTAIKEAGIHTMQITHRVKTVESALGKLSKKPEKYHTATDMTDLVGFRIICYFTEQIDQISAIIEDLFDIDKDNYIDKSKVLSPNAFGYLSVHYICSLKKSDEYSERLCGIKFEIQIRTVLQHTWAEIEHDLGYKNEFGVPIHVRREFSRMASLLEVADEGFGRIKQELASYSAKVIDKLQRGDADDIAIDALSLKEFMKYNQDYHDLIGEISSITGASISEAPSDQFISQLCFLGITNLGSLTTAIKKNRDFTITIAHDSLEGMEIEELSSFVGLYYLCRALLISGPYGVEDINRFFGLQSAKPLQIEHNTNRILKQRETYGFDPSSRA